MNVLRRVSNSAVLIQRHKPGAGFRFHVLHRYTLTVCLCCFLQVAGVCGAIALYWWVHPAPGIVFGILMLASFSPPLVWLVRERRREVEIWRLERELEQQEEEAEARKGSSGVELESFEEGEIDEEGGTAKFQSKGGLQFVWLTKMNKDPDPVGLNGASNRRKIPLEEVSRHASADDLWIIIRNKVYNVTQYAAYHPGGLRELMRSAGADGTALYNEIHPWIDIGLIGKLQVGILDKHSRLANKESVLDPRIFRSFKVSHTSWDTKDVLRLRVDLGEPTKTMCGQHVVMRLGSNKRIERQYTPIRDPKAKGSAEFLVKVYPNGVMGQALAKLTAGDSVEMVGPRGDLVYHGSSVWKRGVNKMQAHHLILCGAGSGITPMMQILRTLALDWETGKRPFKVDLFSCNRTEEDILCREELEDLAKTYSDCFSLRFMLSKPPEDSETWRTPKANVIHIDGRINTDVLREVIGPLSREPNKSQQSLPQAGLSPVRTKDSEGKTPPSSPERTPEVSIEINGIASTSLQTNGEWDKKTQSLQHGLSELDDEFVLGLEPDNEEKKPIVVQIPPTEPLLEQTTSAGSLSLAEGNNQVRFSVRFAVTDAEERRMVSRSPHKQNSVTARSFRHRRGSANVVTEGITRQATEDSKPAGREVGRARSSPELVRQVSTSSTSRGAQIFPMLGFVCGPEDFNKAVQHCLASIVPPPQCLVHVF